MTIEQAPSVLVTGASTGIGAATVTALVDRGFRVWAAVRSEKDARRLEDEYGGQVQVLRFDVTDAAAVAAAGARITAAGPLHAVVSNAGMALPGPLEYLPLASLREQLEVNVVGQLAVIQAVLPAIRAGAGRVVVIGSIGGRIAGPILGAYHVSKFALVGLTDTLRAELAPWGIPVALVEPGAVATPIWERGMANGDRVLDQLSSEAVQRYRAQDERARRNAYRSAAEGMSPEVVAQVIVQAVTTGKPRPRYLVGRDAKIQGLVARLPFRLRYRLTAARS
jgi:NAD(P)-dependent dehydrogenase (short-subunit alcohol dehydrogenase family)